MRAKDTKETIMEALQSLQDNYDPVFKDSLASFFTIKEVAE